MLTSAEGSSFFFFLNILLLCAPVITILSLNILRFDIPVEVWIKQDD